DLPATARVAQKATPSVLPRKRRWSAILWGVFGSIALLWIVALMNLRTPQHVQRPDVNEPTRVQSTKLFMDYHENAIAADNMYRAPLIVEGKVKDIGKDIRGIPYLILGDREDVMQGVQLLFDDERGGLASLSRGSRVAVRCERNDGHFVMNVILNHCSLTR